MGQVLRAGVRGLAAGALAIFLTLPGLAGAQDDDTPLPTWYAGPMVGYMFPDAARDADRGINLQGVLGFSLADSLAVELNGFGTKIKRTSGGNDAVNGGGLDLTLGTAAPGNPFFLIGGGAVQQELAGIKKTSSFGELGLGVYLPFSFFGELWRLEGRYGLIFNNHPTLASQDLIEDGRINLGVMFPLGRQPVERIPEQPAQPVGPDSDGDGVPDAQDQCPDTPKWARVDKRGCIPDSDGDGIDDSKDECPGTPAGTPVDAKGCVVQAQPPAPPVAEPVAPVAPVEVPDEDKDGVPDADDKCPHTPPHMEVDEHGCVKPEDVTLHNVHFDVDSSRLTADGYTLLRQVAAALKAQPDLKVEVVGHADATGSVKHNLKLSQERAQVVRDFLTYAGVAPQQLAPKGAGKSQPIRDNKNREDRSYNRRVEFRRVNNP